MGKNWRRIIFSLFKGKEKGEASHWGILVTIVAIVMIIGGLVMPMIENMVATSSIAAATAFLTNRGYYVSAEEGGATTFLGLTDTPSLYTGNASKFVSVKGDESGVEFIAGDPAAGAFTDLTDTPGSLSGSEGELARVNVAGDALEFTNVSFVGAIKIAANDASAAEKVAALLSGGIICDTINDEGDILTACTTVGSNGVVLLSSGTFDIDNDLTVSNSCTIIGTGSRNNTTLNITGTTVGIKVTNTYSSYPSITRLHGVRILTPTSYTDTALTVESNGPLWHVDKILDDIYIHSYNGEITGTGLKINQYNNNTGNEESIAFCTFGPISVRGYEHSAHIYVYRRTSGSAYFNSNYFEALYLGRGKYLLDIEIDGDATEPYHACQADYFNYIALQPHWTSNNTDYGIRLISTDNEEILNNQFNIQTWDWSNAEYDLIECSTYSEGNVFKGGLSNNYGDIETYTIDDNSGLNIFINTTRDQTIIGQPGNPGYQEVWGDVIAIPGIAGQSGMIWGEIVYQDSTDSGKWKQTDADAASTADGRIGILLSTSPSDDADITILIRGCVDNNAWPTLTIGSKVYISTTAGSVTLTAPNGSSDVVRIIGYALGSDAIYFNASNDWEVIP